VGTERDGQTTSPAEKSADAAGDGQSLTNGLLGTGGPMTFTDVGGALTPTRTYRVLLH
jgi:hypothetical protein